MNIVTELVALAEEEYKEFHSSLVPTMDKNRILGVRVPVLRKYAKQLFREGNYYVF